MASLKILIVEDELLIAHHLSRKLEKFGYLVVDIVSSGEDALASLQHNQPDLVLMDIVIQGNIDGIETASQIYQLYDIPVIYLTAYADNETLERAEKTGAYGYLLKPFKEQALNATIKMAMRKHLESTQRRQLILAPGESQATTSNFLDYDSITQLPNRLSLREQFNQVLRKNQLEIETQNIETQNNANLDTLIP
jgi:CheY-like chemotaxis protein